MSATHEIDYLFFMTDQVRNFPSTNFGNEYVSVNLKCFAFILAFMSAMGKGEFSQSVEHAQFSKFPNK